ncbi:MAG: response regulator [Balneolales bacterium]|nr:response regulator [Balneolales bacterium]
MSKMGPQLLLICLIWLIPNLVSGQESTPLAISISDTDSYGDLVLHNLDGWQFSFETPSEIRDRQNLLNTIPVDIRDFKELKDDPRWTKYGWFELTFHADSTLTGLPLLLTHLGHEPVRMWLNGVLVLQNGNPSPNAENEKLARFINSMAVGVMLREGTNYVLIEHSEHTSPVYLNFYTWFSDGIFVNLEQYYESYQRRHRAFIFGGTLMLLTLLVLIHAYLSFKFRGKHHTYVTLTTFSMLVMAFATLSDTLINWTYTYLYFFEFAYAISLVLIAYFFMISVRMIFNLTVPWKTLTTLCFTFITLGIISLFIDRTWYNIIHPTMLVATMVYVFYSLWEARRVSPDAKIGIVAAGIIGTVLGSVLYTLVYLAFNFVSHGLLITSVLLSFTGIPISLTFNVARNYANLIGTLEGKVQERTADLELANSYQKRFFANISHEFRTPLTISEGLVNKLLRVNDVTPEKAQHDLSVIKRNMSRLNDMVDQIIDLTKSEQNHLHLRREHYKADNLASISVESFRSLAEYHGHSFVFKPSAEDAILHVDRSKVEVMINNLISNAIKFTPDGGSIEIRTTTEADNFVLTVQDSGPGIPAGEEDVIFERFHRLKRPDDEYVEGIGVGLELSQSLAQLHNGVIRAVAGIESGALFKLTLPVVDNIDPLLIQKLEDDVEKMIYEPELVQKVSASGNFNILLVEDNEDMRNYVAGILSELGEVERAGNGKEALELLRNYTPDIIITDLMMPVMDGEKLIENLFASKKWANIPVVVLTAKALEDDKLHLLRIGVVDYIIKPFSPEQLLYKTRNLLTYYTRREKLKIALSLDEIPVESDNLSTKATEFIMNNLRDVTLSVDSIADEFSQSRRSFYRNIQLETGLTPAEFIREVKLTVARSIVSKDRSIRLEELANAVGYKSATSFRKMYEKRFGVHPLDN